MQGAVATSFAELSTGGCWKPLSSYSPVNWSAARLFEDGRAALCCCQIGAEGCPSPVVAVDPARQRRRSETRD